MQQRPLSAYNIFFKVQRFMIINDRDELQSTNQIDEIIREVDLSRLGKSSKPTKKRLHRKTHGKIGFSALGKTIGLRWKTCNPEIKSYFNKLANDEKSKYNKNTKTQPSQSSTSTVDGMRPSNSDENDSCIKIQELDSRDVLNLDNIMVDAFTHSKHYRNDSTPSLKTSSHPCKSEDTEPEETSIEPLPFMLENQNMSCFLFDYETCNYVFAALDEKLPPK